MIGLPPPIPLVDRPRTPPDSATASFDASKDGADEKLETMRTLYFGNLPPDISISDFLNYVRGGVLDEVKYLANKNCVFCTFLDASVAAAIYLEYQTQPLTIEGYECRVGWGKPSTLHHAIRSQVLKGASRNVFVGNVDPSQTVESLKNDFSLYGIVDTVKIISEKRIAFVHMCSIASAIRAVNALADDPSWADKRIYFGKDRCATQGPPPMPQGPITPGENRTVYIGGIHPDVTTKDLCDVIRGGILQQIKYFPEKNICFATFVEAEAAASFYVRGTTDGVILKSKRVKIGWGKPTPLPASIAAAVEKGASRNVYIGQIDESVTRDQLLSEFSGYGEIELVNIVLEKKIAFVSFTDITCAMKAVEAMKDRAPSPGALSSSRRGHRRINFGKDRCGNPMRPSKAEDVSPPSSPSLQE
ncbi:hypothetical protein HDU91_000921 [Kappamyces sp. JEL0680]|nr:hypothetical protein HDU91_000921 [Kappamyces sp. JEL0680]